MFKRTRVLLLGSVKGSNRTQAFVEFFHQHKDYSLIVLSASYLHKIPLIGKYFEFLVKSVSFFILLLTADVIFYPAMNEKYLFLLHVAKIFGKYIILDFYSSRYLIATQDRKINIEIDSMNSSFYKHLYQVDVRLLIPDKIFFLSDSDRLFFTSFFDLKPDTSSVDILPLTIDEGSYMALSCNALPQPDVGEIVFAFWGQLSHLHGLEAIFSAFTQAYLEDKRIRLYVFDSDKERIDASKSIACNYENSEYCLHHVHGNWGLL